MTAPSQQTYKFIASSTQEAVDILRTQFGPQARVLSVRQVNAFGWKRFLGAPKIEVVATHEKERLVPLSEPKESLHRSSDPALPSFFFEDKPLSSPGGLESWLTSIGWAPALIEKLKAHREWNLIEKASAPKDRLTFLYQWIAQQYRALPKRALTKRIAVLGSSGVGKTTALCKWLSAAVFSQQEGAQVLTVESCGLECSQRLQVFCQALGVFLGKAPIDNAFINPHQRLLVDTSGISLTNTDNVQPLCDALDELNIDTRVLVVNGAYNHATIAQTLRCAADLSPTHLFFSHVDEVNAPLTLWSILLAHNFPIAGMSLGPSLTHQLSTDPFETLIERTFPCAIVRDNN